MDNIRYFSIFLLLIPSIDLGIGFSQGFAKGILLLSFFIWSFSSKKLVSQNSISLIISSALCLIYSLSVFNTIDIVVFLRSYINVLIGIFIFVSTDKKDAKKYVLTLFFAYLFNILFETYIYILLPFIGDQFLSLLHPTYASYIVYNQERSRLYSSLYLESYLPMIFATGEQFKSKIEKNTALFLIFIQTYLSIISQFRSRLLMLCISYVYILSKRRVIVIIYIIIILLSIFLQNMKTGYSRTINPPSEAIESVEYRVRQYLPSLDYIFSSSTGAGLGNYLLLNSQHNNSSLKKYSEIQYLDKMPHNFFLERGVELGYVGLLVYVVTILYWFIYDIRQIFQKKNIYLIVSFWSLFSFALFNPSNEVTFITLFFLLRALI